MNRRPGIDTPPATNVLFVKLNLRTDRRDDTIAVLKALRSSFEHATSEAPVDGEHSNFEGSPGLRLPLEPLRPVMIVGFGRRFFLGDWGDRERGEEAVPNFPPGGAFKPRYPTRFGIHDRTVPIYLRRMAAAGDLEWVARRQGADPADVAADYERWVSAAESDLLLQIEADNRFLVLQIWSEVQRCIVTDFGDQVELVGRIEEGFSRGDGRDHTGWFDGVSNLDDLMERDPERYRARVYLPHPAPSYPGEPVLNRDDPRFDGGTYLVYRKYVEHLDRWNDPEFQTSVLPLPNPDRPNDPEREVAFGEAARRLAIGRDRDSGKVIHRASGKLLATEPDSAEVNLAYDGSHILQARGGEVAPYKGPFPPLPPGQTHVFKTQDVRVRRRGSNFCELDPETGELKFGLHFVCFQNNIQQTGFEFINNIWLLNPMFRGHVDALFAVEKGVIEPEHGSYYFVPPEHRIDGYPGDVFFER